MSDVKYTVKWTSAFKKDYKLALKRGLNVSLLKETIKLLAMGVPLPPFLPRPCVNRKLDRIQRMPHNAGLAAYLLH